MDAVQRPPVRVAAGRAQPFDVRVPNAETAAAIRKLGAGQGACSESIDDLLADPNADDRATYGVRVGPVRLAGFPVLRFRNCHDSRRSR